MSDDIRPYGPGKFQTIIDSYIYELSGSGCDEETGDVQENGTWYGLRRGSFTLDGAFADADLTEAERGLLTTTAGVIISEDSQGFVYVDYYDTPDELNTAWSKVEDEVSEYYNDADTDEDDEVDEPFEPDEDDITTEDHRRFYQDGKLVVEVGEDEDYKAALRAYMERTNFYPNVWFISDHGNAHLIDLSGK